jgi:hypothetical protein
MIRSKKMKKQNLTEIMNFLKGVMQALDQKLKVLDLAGLTIMLARLKELLDEYSEAAEAYLPNIDFGGFPKRDVFRQLTWVMRNLPGLMKLVNAADHFKAARASADAFADAYGINYKVEG